MFNCRTSTSDCSSHLDNINFVRWDYGCNSWGSTIPIAVCDCDPCNNGEKQGSGRVAIDPGNTSRVYAFFAIGNDTTDCGVIYSRLSTDGGATFAARVAYSACGVDRNGRINIPEKAIGGKIYVAWTPGNHFTINAEGTAVVGATANQVGHTSGWAQGTVTRTNVTVLVAGSNILLFGQTFGEAGGAVIVRAGDSGSPVFRLSGGTNVRLVGLLWGGNSAGTRFIFSPLTNIEAELGDLTTH